jgi:hypothetical protein
VAVLLLAAVAALAVACERRARDCDREVAEHAEWMTAAVAEGLGMWLSGGLELASTDLPPARLDVRRGGVPPPGPSSLDARIADLRVYEGAAQLGRLEGPTLPDLAFKRCQPALDLLPRYAELDMWDKIEAFARELPEAIRECGCRVESAAARMMVWLWLDRDQRPGVRGIMLQAPTDPLDPSAPVIALPADATWEDAIPNVILADGTSALLTVR